MHEKGNIGNDAQLRVISKISADFFGWHGIVPQIDGKAIIAAWHREYVIEIRYIADSLCQGWALSDEINERRQSDLHINGVKKENDAKIRIVYISIKSIDPVPSCASRRLHFFTERSDLK